MEEVSDAMTEQPTEPESLSKINQALITYGIGGTAAYFLWDTLQSISKGLFILFGIIAGLAIHSGTWMQSSRDLKRQQRDERRKAYREVKGYLTGKGSLESHLTRARPKRA